MIYTASLFRPEQHHGRRVAICRTLPQGAVVDRHLKFLAPPARLHWDWNLWKQEFGGIGENRIWEYKERYWLHLQSVWGELSDYLNNFPEQETETWLCWEQPGEFCHRNLLLKLIARDWPQHMGRGGGGDVPFEVATPGIAWACEEFGLKPIFTPIVPESAAPDDGKGATVNIDSSSEQLLFFQGQQNI